MNKKILILEPSKTTQSIINERLHKSGFSASYESEGIKFINSIYTIKPAALLINAKTVNPKTSELIRLIKSIDAIKTIPLAVYATSDFTFENAYMTNTGADLFIQLENDSIAERLNDLLLLEKKWSALRWSIIMRYNEKRDCRKNLFLYKKYRKS